MKLKSLLFLTFTLVLFGCYHLQDNPDFKRAKAYGLPIYVSHLEVYPPNSAGGVNVAIWIRNISERPFKYVYLTLKPYNRVGDLQSSEIGNHIRSSIKLTGPIKALGTEGGQYKNLWYNHSIRCAELVKIEIVYFDGDSTVITGEELSKATEPIKNSCAF